MDAPTLAAIAAAATPAPGADAPPLAQLRQAFPGIVFSLIDAADIAHEPPAARAGARALYLLDTRHHCPVLTRDLTVASGVVLTR